MPDIFSYQALQGPQGPQGSGNQFITLTGATTGSGTTSIATTLATGLSPTFSGVTDTALAQSGVVFAGTSGVLSTDSGYFIYNSDSHQLYIAGSANGADLTLDSPTGLSNGYFHIRMMPSILNSSILLQSYSTGGELFSAGSYGSVGSNLYYSDGTNLYNLGLFSQNPEQQDNNGFLPTFYPNTNPLALGYTIQGIMLETPPAYFSIKNKVNYNHAPYYGASASINPGTVFFTTGTNVINGVGTNFTQSFVPGDVITAGTGAKGKTVTGVTSDTALTISTNVTSTASGRGYTGSKQLYFAAGGVVSGTVPLVSGQSIELPGVFNGSSPYWTITNIVNDNVVRLNAAPLYSTTGIYPNLVNGNLPDAFQVVPNPLIPAQFGCSVSGLPTAQVHIGAGTSGAGTAPIKLTPGPLLSTPEDGALEYDGTNLYFTIGATRHTIV